MAASGYRTVALVSGGKDSCYSMHLCQQHGHEVVALANLLPADSAVDELDSYMYQTVGHQLVEAYAACSGLPLYRRRIQGRSHSQGLSYIATEGDEVEDLLLLLAYVKAAHPDVQAVASGAIASDYQRLRVESVCSRLGLVSLAYLWHQPQDPLVSAMIDAAIHAVLVKVAALGLDPHKHLGKSLAQLQPHLRSLRRRFGCNVAGEGGEYETLTLDCPAFTHGRIVLREWEVVLHSPDSIAAVGVLHPTAFDIEPKVQQQQQLGGVTPSSAALPASARVTEVPPDWQPPQPAAQAAAATGAASSSNAWPSGVQVQVHASEHHVHILAAPCRREQQEAAAALTPADTAAALDAVLCSVSAALDTELANVTAWDLSCFVHLYLADMSHFGVANAAYCRHLPQTNPPSRACVQVPLPEGLPLLLDVLLARGGSSSSSSSSSSCDQAAAVNGRSQAHQQPQRRVLHVQSISDWAPSCIGPYSQATCCNGLVHMAGQIPLDPGSMQIVSAAAAEASSTPAAADIAQQVWRTLCSCQAVAVAVRSCFASSSLGLTVYLTPECAAAGGQQLVAAALQAIWRDRSLLDHPSTLPAALVAAAAAAAAECSSVTPTGQGSNDSNDDGAGSDAGSDADADDNQALPPDDYLLPPAVQQPLCPAVIYLTVSALPRGALLEVQPLLLDLTATHAAPDSSSNSSSSSRASDDGAQQQPAVQQQLRVLAGGVQAHTTTTMQAGWTRHVVMLPASSIDTTGDGGAAQAAAAAAWLSGAAATAAAVRPGMAEAVAVVQAVGHQTAPVTLRCWWCDGDNAAAAPPASRQAGGRGVRAVVEDTLRASGLGHAQLVPLAPGAPAVVVPSGPQQQPVDCWAVYEMLVFA